MTLPRQETDIFAAYDAPAHIKKYSFASHPSISNKIVAYKAVVKCRHFC